MIRFDPFGAPEAAAWLAANGLPGEPAASQSLAELIAQRDGRRPEGEAATGSVRPKIGFVTPHSVRA